MQKQNKDQLISRVLLVATVVTAVLLFLVAFIYTEMTAGILALAVLLIVELLVVAYRNQKAIKEAAATKTARYGFNAAVSVSLAVGILVVLNFLNYNHYWKKDLTKTGTYSLSEQTVKLLKELKQDVKVTVYVKAQGREQLKGTIDNYRYFAKKMTVEYVDPDRDPARTKAANVKKYGTVILEAGKKEVRVDDLNEEKFTNALIKLSKNKSQTVCFLTGHGEKSPESNEQDGYSAIKKDMAQSNWETKTLNLLEEGKVNEACTVVLVLGPNKAFFDKELDVLQAWLHNGGRALFALDPNIQKTEDTNKQPNDLLSKWFVKVKHNIVVDPLSKLMGAEASVPIVATYSKEVSITKDFQATTLFPLSSSVEILTGVPGTVKVQWLAKSTPKSFAETNFKELATGRATMDAADQAGPLDMMVAVSGKLDSKVANETRLVVLGTSNLASNMYSKYAQNSDLFLNAVSWLADDESLISIRPKEEGAQAITLSQTEGRFIQLLSMVMVPLFTLGTGILTYVRRRKL